MKNLKKKLVALGLGLATMASSVMSMSASAFNPFLQYDSWPNATYLPYVGTFHASSSGFTVTNLRWNSTQTTGFNSESGTYGVEFEVRPLSYTPAEIWNAGSGSLSSNLPMQYFEFDVDDVTIRCGDLKQIVAEKVYYGTLSMTNKTNPVNTPYVFECEYCKNLGVATDISHDYWPLRYTQYEDAIFGSVYKWDKNQ